MVPPPAQDQDSVVVSGFIAGVEAKPNGRFSVKVKQDASEQYGQSLNTKDNEIVSQLMAAIGQHWTFQCGLSHWTRQDGSPVTSKWINGAYPTPAGQQQLGTGSPAAPQGAVPTATQPQPTPSTFDREVAITWQAMAKGLPVACFKRLPTDEQTLDAAVRIADYWALQALLRAKHGIPQGAPPQLQPGDVYQGDPGPPEGDPGPQGDYDPATSEWPPGF